MSVECEVVDVPSAAKGDEGLLICDCCHSFLSIAPHGLTEAAVETCRI